MSLNSFERTMLRVVTIWQPWENYVTSLRHRSVICKRRLTMPKSEFCRCEIMRVESSGEWFPQRKHSVKGSEDSGDDSDGNDDAKTDHTETLVCWWGCGGGWQWWRRWLWWQRQQCNGKTLISSDHYANVFVDGDNVGEGEHEERKRNKKEKRRETEERRNWKKKAQALHNAATVTRRWLGLMCPNLGCSIPSPRTDRHTNGHGLRPIPLLSQE